MSCKSVLVSPNIERGLFLESRKKRGERIPWSQQQQFYILDNLYPPYVTMTFPPSSFSHPSLPSNLLLFFLFSCSLLPCLSWSPSLASPSVLLSALFKMKLTFCDIRHNPMWWCSSACAKNINSLYSCTHHDSTRLNLLSYSLFKRDTHICV